MNKTKVKHIRLSESELKMIMKNAEKVNMNFSAYVRRRCLQDIHCNPELRNAVHSLTNEVNSIGHNINQIVKNNNSGLYSEIDKVRLMEYMRIIDEKVTKLFYEITCRHDVGKWKTQNEIQEGKWNSTLKKKQD